MPNNNNSIELDELLFGIDQRTLESDELSGFLERIEELSEEERMQAVQKFVQEQFDDLEEEYLNKWEEQYLNDYPAERCVLEALLPECDKMKKAYEDVQSFILLETEKDFTLLCGGVSNKIREYYPETSLEMLLDAVDSVRGKQIIALKKGIKLVIADAVAAIFQRKIQDCCQNVREPNCLCILIQTLMTYGFNQDSIGRILGKNNDAVRKLLQRCKENINQHYDVWENEEVKCEKK